MYMGPTVENISDLSMDQRCVVSSSQIFCLVIPSMAMIVISYWKVFAWFTNAEFGMETFGIPTSSCRMDLLILSTSHMDTSINALACECSELQDRGMSILVVESWALDFSSSLGYHDPSFSLSHYHITCTQSSLVFFVVPKSPKQLSLLLTLIDRRCAIRIWSSDLNCKDVEIDIFPASESPSLTRNSWNNYHPSF